MLALYDFMCRIATHSISLQAAVNDELATMSRDDILRLRDSCEILISRCDNIIGRE